jgi:hypothetical protein
MRLGLLVPQHGPLSQDSASWTEWSPQESQARLALVLLRARVPVLVLGERQGTQVFKEIQRCVTASLATTK